MRIVSLHPACTEWVAAFGALGDLVGRSHTCELPATARRVPAVTLPGSEKPDLALRRPTDRNPLILNENLLAELKPDVLLAAEGVSAPDLERIRWSSDRKPLILDLDPVSFKEVLDGALRMGKAIGRLPEAMRYIGGTEKNLLKLQRRLANERNVPPRRSVLCIEGCDPLWLAGRWVPDLVELAGGTLHPDVREGGVSWNELLQMDPDVLALVPLTGGIDAAHREADQLPEMPGWQGLRAVRSGRVYAFDGALFHFPGPRLYHAIELLAAALHPDRVGITPHREEMARVRTASSPAQ